MQFREHQQEAQTRTLRLFACFALLLIALTVLVNLFLALAWRLLTPLGHGFPNLFFEANTAVVMLFVVGGSWVESQRLSSGGGPRVARWLGAHPVEDNGDALSRRLLNVVDEMAIASGQSVPQVFLMPREDAINAFVAGWGPKDTVLCVTRGALERLQRAELQGLIAHEFGHLQEDDLPLTMRMLALVWGLSLVHGWGQSLMAADDDGHVNPLRWLAGVVFAGVGWLGWLAGRVLQAAVTRQREFLADACAVQFTRTRDGLGGVLRKIWHDHDALAGRMRHPASDMVAALLLHDGQTASWLASHPPLKERIRRICGTILPPLPAPLIRLDATEPRRIPPPIPEGAMAAAADANSFAAQAHLSPGELRRQAVAADREALARLQLLGGPTELRLLTLALMLNPSNDRERKLWAKWAEGMPQSQRILDDVAALLPVRRVPEFERVTGIVNQSPIEQRRALAEQARDLLRADGRVSPRERLWWLVLRHRLGENRHAPGHIRPVTGQGQSLHELNPEQRHHATALSAYLARLIPADADGAELPAPNTAWFVAVTNRCGAHHTASGLQMPDADALAHALAGAQEMSWMLRPQLIKAWVEETFNHSPQGLLSDASADALRLMARLLDAPLPPMLEDHYRF